MDNRTLYETAAADPGVTALLGDPPRIHPMGHNPDDPRIYPYATFYEAAGTRGNLLAGRPTHRQALIHLDVWAQTQASMEAVANALEHALELRGPIQSFGQRRDPETGSFRQTLEISWITLRTTQTSPP